jgi:hypothetical protein
MTDAEARRLRRAIIEADPSVPILLSGEAVAAILGITDRQVRARIKNGDLEDFTDGR